MDLYRTAQQLLRRYLVVRGITSSVVTLHGHPLHYYEARGKPGGPSALLVHGLGGSANGFFRVLEPLTARFSQVVAPDLTGHGFSAKAPGRALRLDEQFGLLRAFADTVIRGPLLAVGNSLGGAMAITLANERRERVRALALVAPAGGKVPQERMEELARSMRVTTNAEARALTRRLFHRAPATALLFASELRKMYGTEVVQAALEEARETPHLAPELLSRLDIPTLLLWGGSEKLLPYEGLEFFRAHLPPHARIEVVPKFGHVPQVEYPREVIRRLLAFAAEAGL